MSTNTTVISTKLPVTFATRVEDLARSKRLTVSLLLRQVLEAAVETTSAEHVGPIEATTRARLDQILDADALDPRASVACELARRLDVDPSNGVQHSRELIRLLDDLEGEARSLDRPPNPLDELHARRLLSGAGYGLTDPSGKVLSKADPEAGALLVERRRREADRRGRLLTRMSEDD
jgi:hypothetical protein